MVDWLRAPYTTQCRFWEDSDQEVTINWYPAADGVPCLPFPTVFSSRHWSEWRDFTLDGPGEVFGEETYSPKRANPDAKGTHICGTPADFAGHAKRDPNPPFQKYDANQLPECCGAPQPLEAPLLIDFIPELVEVCTPVTGGTTCHLAPLLDLDTLYCLELPGFFGNLWYTWLIDHSGTWGLCFPDNLPAGYSYRLFFIPDCDHTGHDFSIFPGDHCTESSPVGPGQMTLRITGTGGPTADLRCHGFEGTCAANCP